VGFVRFGWGERKKDFGGAVEGGSEMAPAASSTIFSMLSPCQHVFSAPYASKEQQWQQQHPSTQGPRNLLCRGVEIVSVKKSSSQGSLLDCRQQIWGVALPVSCRRNGLGAWTKKKTVWTFAVPASGANLVIRNQSSESSAPYGTQSSGTTTSADGSLLSMVTQSSAGVPRQLHMSDGEQDYSVTFDNETSPGRTEVGIDGMDQENLLMDVTTSFSEMGIRLKLFSFIFVLFFSRYPRISTEVPPCCSR
jgi:hypothetical protein